MCSKFLATLMLSGANREKYGELKHSMAENYVTGTSKYPVSPEVVLRILSAYVGPQIGMNPESLWGLPKLEY